MKLPQLSLRELFLFVVIAAMGCGWWANRNVLLMENKRVEEEAAERIERAERSAEVSAAKSRIELYGHKLLIRDFQALTAENLSLQLENQKYRLAEEYVNP